MIISKNEHLKLISLAIVAFCAVFVCHLFLNYGMDLAAVEHQISPQLLTYYESQQMLVQFISYLTGGCLALISFLLLSFYIQRFINEHQKELGILKALGYSAWRLALNMSSFAFHIFWGAGLGFAASFLLMKSFYQFQNEKELLPEIAIHFHWELFLLLVCLPTLIFFLLAFSHAYLSLQRSANSLLSQQIIFLRKRKSSLQSPFLQEMRKASLFGKPSLLFFLIFATFSYSAMTQMSFGILELATDWMAFMIFVIGLILSAVILTLSLNHVLSDNKESLALMKVMGYSDKDCRKSILDGFRPFAWLGFLIGTLYQFGLLQLLLILIFKDSSVKPSIDFDWQAFGLTALTFLIAYEGLLTYLANRIRKQNFKAILLG